MTIEEFQKIDQDLSIITDQNAQSSLAQTYSSQQGWDQPMAMKCIADKLLYNTTETTTEDLMRLKLRDYTIPYITGSRRPFFIQRLLYFWTSMCFEEYINAHRNDPAFKFLFRDVAVKGPSYTRASGDHTRLAMGRGKNVPDFYIWHSNRAVMSEFKFISKFWKTNVEDVKDYFSTKRCTSLHNAPTILIFLEQEEAFYLIDYDFNTITRLAWACPADYPTSESIKAAVVAWQNDIRLKEIQYGNYK